MFHYREDRCNESFECMGENWCIDRFEDSTWIRLIRNRNHYIFVYSGARGPRVCTVIDGNCKKSRDVSLMSKDERKWYKPWSYMKITLNDAITVAMHEIVTHEEGNKSLENLPNESFIPDSCK